MISENIFIYNSRSFLVSVSSSNISWGTVSGGGTLKKGTTVTVTASPASGYVFVNWTDNGTPVSTSASYSFTLTGDRNLVANFAVIQYTVSLGVNPSGSGSVSGGGTYNVNSTANISATANAGYVFVNWSDGNTSASRSISVTGNISMTANFTIQSTTFTIQTPAGSRAGTMLLIDLAGTNVFNQNISGQPQAVTHGSFTVYANQLTRIRCNGGNFPLYIRNGTNLLANSSAPVSIDSTFNWNQITAGGTTILMFSDT